MTAEMTVEKDRARLGMMISGGGTTMEQITLACKSGELEMNVAAVIASKPDIGGIQRARDLGIPQESRPKKF